MRRMWTRLRWGRPCGAPPPWRLADAGTCVQPRRRHGVPDEGWHGDGNGYIWNDRLGRWRWMGPVIDLAELYPEAERDDMGAYTALFTEPDMTVIDRVVIYQPKDDQ